MGESEGEEEEYVSNKNHIKYYQRDYWEVYNQKLFFPYLIQKMSDKKKFVIYYKYTILTHYIKVGNGD